MAGEFSRMKQSVGKEKTTKEEKSASTGAFSRMKVDVNAERKPVLETTKPKTGSSSDYQSKIRQLTQRKHELEAGLDLIGAAKVQDEIDALNRQNGTTLFDRAKNTASGAGKSYLGSVVNSLASLYDVSDHSIADALEKDAAGMYERQYQRFMADYQEMLEENRKNPGTWSQELLQRQKEMAEKSRTVYENLTGVLDSGYREQTALAAYGLADELAYSGNKDIEKAKEGLDGVGRFAVDTAAAIGQYGADIAASSLTGGSALLPMAFRGYGGGAQQARQDGADKDRAALFGIASAALETATEQIGNIGVSQKFFGGGALDDVLKGMVRSLEQKGKTKAGQAVLNRIGTAGTAFLSEGLEEFISSAASPYLAKAIYSDDPINFGEVLGDALYDFAVGGAVGGVLGGTFGSNSRLDAYMDQTIQEETSVAQSEQSRAANDAIARMLEEQGVEGAAVQRQAAGVDMLINGGEMSSKLANELRRSQAAQEVYRQMTGEELDLPGKPGEIRQRLKDLAAERMEQNVVDAEIETTTMQAPDDPPVFQQETAVPTVTEEPATAPMAGTELGGISSDVQRINQVDRMAANSQVLGPVGKKAAVARYDGITDPDAYYEGYMKAYNAGLSGKRGNIPSVLNRTQYNDAFRAGRLDAQSGNRPSDAGTIDALARKLGVRVVAGETLSGPDGQRINGYIKDGVIHIDKDATDKAMVVFKHEVTHLLQDRDAAGYQAFRDYAVQVMGEDSINQILNDYSSPEARESLTRGGKQSYLDGAMDEVAANFTEKLFTDQKSVQQLIQDDRNLAQKIFDIIRDLVRKLTDKEGARLRDAEKMWARMFEEVAGQDNSTRGTMDARYSEKDGVTNGRENQTEQFPEGAGPQRAVYQFHEEAVRRGQTVRVFQRDGKGGEGTRPRLGRFTPVKNDETSETAKRTIAELKKLGIPSFIHRGDLEVLSGNGDILSASEDAATVNLSEVGIANSIDIAPKETAGHEAYHFWKKSEFRQAYSDIVLDNIQWTSPDFSDLYDHINEKYFGNQFDMEDKRQNAVFQEELIAYISGRIHSGENISWLLNDYTSVKTAWNNLVIENGGKIEPSSSRFSMKSSVDEMQENYSIKQDSQGRQLTKEQQEYFRDSKVVDSNGNLLVLYHGTTAYGEITKFRRGRSGWLGPGIYLASRKADAQRYADAMGEGNGHLYELYANVTRPLVVTDGNPVPEILREAYGRDSIYKSRSAKQSNDTRIITSADIKKLQGKGYDGIQWNFGGNTEVSVFSAEQIKRVDNESPTSDPDIRFSLRQENERLEDVAGRLDQIRRDGEQAGKSEEEILTDIRAEVDSALEQLRTQYGTIPPGEQPTREANVPKRTRKNDRISQTVRTVIEGKATPDSMVPTIQEAIVRGDFSYESVTDKMAIDQAASTITEESYQDTKEKWLADVESGNVSKENTALGWALYNNAANSGNVEDAMKFLTAMIEHQRSAAQAVQATRIFKRSSPTAQLYGVKRSVENLQKKLKERYGDKAPDLEISRDLAEQFLKANTPEEQAEALKKLYMDIGRQMPSTFMDKWTAWRYLAMLGNPRTHIRNIVGNAVFAPVVGVKNLTATAIEEIVDRAAYKGTMNRSKGFLTGSKADRELAKAAWDDFSKVYDEIQGAGKYSDSAQANRDIQEGRVIFQSKLLHFLEVLRKKNGDLLNLEDMWFSQPHYAAALAGYMKANGITASQLKNGRGVAQARAYAVLEAQKATFRDMNQFSELVSGIGRYRGENKFKRAKSVFIEGVLPFRQTPANILVRGVEYSPLGLLKSLTFDLNQVRTGKMEAYEAIDHISAGLTGTGIMALGVLFASLGLVRGAGGDDKEKREFEELMGHQAYALELPGGTSVTLDWLAPEALPFFVGVNLWEQAGKKNKSATMSDVIQALSGITKPMLEMSVLQSLNDLINSVGYASSNGLDGLMSILASSATSYLTQGIPTLFGQLERTAQDKRMTTYTEQDAFLTGDMQYTLGTSSGRIPGWDYQQIPYLDAWGRAEETGGVVQRGLNNFLNPAYTSTIQESGMEQELLRLYEETGDGSLLPSRAPKYFTVDKERKNLTAEEYIQYASTRGQTAYDLLMELAEESAYRTLSDESKAELVKDVYSYADAAGKVTVSDYVPKGLDKELMALDAGGFDVADYLLLRAAGDAEGLSDLEIAVSAWDSALSAQLVLNNYDAQRTAEAFTDPSRSGYEYRMDEVQQAQFSDLYEVYMEDALDRLFESSRYQKADTQSRRDMVSELQSETNAKVKKEMARQLRAYGVKSEKK